MSPQGMAPDAASCTARTPQVGPSIQEIGRTQPGSRDSGIMNPQISHSGNSSTLPSAQADRNLTTLTDSRKPNIPTDITVTTTPPRNPAGWPTVSGIPNSSRAQISVAAMLYRPTVDIASVTGASVAENGDGAAARSSSVPSRRWCCIAPAPAVLAAAQMPIMLAPTATAASRRGAPAPYIRNADVEKNIGQITPSTPLNHDRDSILRCISQPMATTRSTLTNGLPRPVPRRRPPASAPW